MGGGGCTYTGTHEHRALHVAVPRHSNDHFGHRRHACARRIRDELAHTPRETYAHECEMHAAIAGEVCERGCDACLRVLQLTVLQQPHTPHVSKDRQEPFWGRVGKKYLVCIAFQQLRETYRTGADLPVLCRWGLEAAFRFCQFTTGSAPLGTCSCKTHHEGL